MKRIISSHQTFSSAIRRPRIAFAVSGVSLPAVIWLGATVGREFLPELDEGWIWLQVQMPAGISLTKTTEMAACWP